MRFKNGAIVVLLLVTFLCCPGCETARGIGRGVAEIGDGVGKDMTSAGAAIIKADGWFRENLW